MKHWRWNPGLLNWGMQFWNCLKTERGRLGILRSISPNAEGILRMPLSTSCKCNAARAAINLSRVNTFLFQAGYSKCISESIFFINLKQEQTLHGELGGTTTNPYTFPFYLLPPSSLSIIQLPVLPRSSLSLQAFSALLYTFSYFSSTALSAETSCKQLKRRESPRWFIIWGMAAYAADCGETWCPVWAWWEASMFSVRSCVAWKPSIITGKTERSTNK